MLNPTCDDWTNTTSDNADAYDITPNNMIFDNTGTEVTSPYQPIWDNDPLEDWLEVFYLGAAGSLDEQPGSTSSGNGGTRGVKLYMDTTPPLPGLCSRRIYQKVEGLTIGLDYTFSVDSRSEAAGTDSEVYILNTQIANETGINANGAADASVDAYMDIVAADPWATFTTASFTATNTFAVVYIRALGAVDGNTEVFYDNFSLVEEVLSVDDVLASKFNVYPNPAKDFLTIDSRNINISSVNVFNVLGTKVLERKELNDNKLNISSLSNGVYFLSISADDATVTKKFIVE